MPKPEIWPRNTKSTRATRIPTRSSPGRMANSRSIAVLAFWSIVRKQMILSYRYGTMATSLRTIPQSTSSMAGSCRRLTGLKAPFGRRCRALRRAIINWQKSMASTFTRPRTIHRKRLFPLATRIILDGRPRKHRLLQLPIPILLPSRVLSFPSTIPGRTARATLS